MAAVKPNRREFLNYIWAASMALTMASVGGAGIVFALPRLRQQLASAETDTTRHPHSKFRSK